MKLLLDTHLLLWAGLGTSAPASSGGLSAQAQSMILNPSNELYYSAASVWEVAIKTGLSKPEFNVDPHLFRRALDDAGYRELSVEATHAAGVVSLPPVHKDPFDRLLIAQAMHEGILLLTNDATVASYAPHGFPVQLV